MQQLRGSERPQGSLRGLKLQVRGWRQEARGKRLEARCWKLEARGQKLEARCWRPQAGSMRHVAVKGV